MDPLIDLLLVIEAEIATTQIIEQILEACEAHGIQTIRRLLNDLKISDIRPGTMTVFVRCADPCAQAWADALSAANHPFLYYIDDNFWRIVGRTQLAAYYRHAVIRHSLEAIVSRAKVVMTGSPELASFVSRFNPKVAVLPASFDFSLIAAAVPKASPGEVRIGFAGSLARQDDLALIAPLIPRVLNQFPNAVFEFIGAFPPGTTESERVRRWAYQTDYSAYVRWQTSRAWAIGLAPLMDHEANRAKTDNKYREYGAFRCAGIYSAIPPYATVVEHGKTGLLAENTPEAWFDAITALLRNSESRKMIAQQAFEDIRARYGLPQVAAEWSKLLRNTFAHPRPDPMPIDALRLKRKMRRALLLRWRVHIALRYREGGMYAVAIGAIGFVLRRSKRFLARI